MRQWCQVNVRLKSERSPDFGGVGPKVVYHVMDRCAGRLRELIKDNSNHGLDTHSDSPERSVHSRDFATFRSMFSTRTLITTASYSISSAYFRKIRYCWSVPLPLNPKFRTSVSSSVCSRTSEYRFPLL